MSARPLPRRGLLKAGLGAGALLAAGVVGAKTGLLAGGSSQTVGPLDEGSFVSAARRGARTGWSIAYPPGHDGESLPVLVVLHGRGGTHRSAFSDLHLDRYLAAAVGRGGSAFAIASVDGGDHSYWHPRRDGDSAAMVVDEFLPLLASRRLNVARIGLLGWSMGGYGALYLTTVLRHRVAVAVAESPAIWHQAAQSADGAFDDAADFDAHSVFGRLALLRGVSLRVDCGSDDGFAPVTRDLRAALSPTPAGGIEAGGHNAAYWRSQAPAQLAFVAAHLAQR